MFKVNLLEGKFHCCGTLCPKIEAQHRIDRMQRVIDATHEYLNYGGYSEELLRELKKELRDLSSN